MTHPRRRTASCGPTSGACRPARRAPAARRRPPGRAAAGARRPGHRQDHHAGRGDRRPDRAPGRPPRRGPRADVLPQGRRAAPRPGHRPARPHHVDDAQLDLPLLRLRADPPLRAGRALRGPLRLLTAPEQDVVLRELLTDHPESVAGPTRCAARSAPAGSPARSTRCCPGPARRGSTATTCGARRGRGAAGVRRGRALPRPVPRRSSTTRAPPTTPT